MANYDNSRNEEIVLDPTESRQGNRKRTNFRVLVWSMLLAILVGVVLVAGFWRATPPAMDYSSGGKLSESTGGKPAPATTPNAAPQTPPATTP